MVTDEQRTRVIVALADALVAISQESVGGESVEALAQRFDLGSQIVDPHSDLAINARQLKLATLTYADAVRGMQRLAREALGTWAETVAEARLAAHAARLRERGVR